MTDYASQLEANIRQDREARDRYARQTEEHGRKMKMLADGMDLILLNYELGMQAALIDSITPKRRRWWWFR